MIDQICKFIMKTMCYFKTKFYRLYIDSISRTAEICLYVSCYMFSANHGSPTDSRHLPNVHWRSSSPYLCGPNPRKHCGPVNQESHGVGWCETSRPGAVDVTGAPLALTSMIASGLVTAGSLYVFFGGGRGPASSCQLLGANTLDPSDQGTL